VSLFFCDTETTGLDLNQHEVWEIAYAFDDEPVHSAIVPHTLAHADPVALEVGQYIQRGGEAGRRLDTMPAFESELIDRLWEERPMLVGANPAFDAYRLMRRWRREPWAWRGEPWHHRLFDIQAYAVPFLDSGIPLGMAAIAERLLDYEPNLPQPDHTAAGDVLSLRAAFRTLQRLYEDQRVGLGLL